MKLSKIEIVKTPLEIKEKIKEKSKVTMNKYMKGTNQRSFENVMIKINDKRVFEHRYIWEQSNGKIPKDYFIHHINGNKKDNRLLNLKLVSRKEHGRLHRIMNRQKKIFV